MKGAYSYPLVHNLMFQFDRKQKGLGLGLRLGLGKIDYTLEGF